MFQGCCWRLTERCAVLRSFCRVHFLRNLLSHVTKAGQVMVAAAM
jgi:transposase-like protein